MDVYNQTDRIVCSTEQLQLVVRKVLEKHRHEARSTSEDWRAALDALSEAAFVVDEHHWDSSVDRSRISLVDSLIALRQRIDLPDQRCTAKGEVGSLIADLQQLVVFG
ncbi:MULTISPECIES: hypothetical protein [Corallincola]|uniref:Uncharacterized protein n=3 Tax=Corallincola TaxID=1775176 RepID=A0A368NQN7_9GAMM|nr:MULTISPECIES: hypothetical protein [Corallincola]RCU52862.1 hypothetical protein DU002_02550 [Corallincola holothuriorum]TAA47985.1 hypothetical protein EXY25_01700 [Corallincola spongiicola]TCI03361.1 hypothetical protein EZV61_10835 [Corallincola luteus]